MEGQKKGTYAAVEFDEQTKQKIEKYIEAHKLPNAVASSKLHTTLLYSKKHLPDYVAQGKIDPPIIGHATGLKVWPSQPDEDGYKSNCLVMTYSCPQLVARHKELMSEHDATYDFDEYHPHITLSYDIGDMKIKDLGDVKTEIGSIVIIKEYGEELNLDWAKKNSTKA